MARPNGQNGNARSNSRDLTTGVTESPRSERMSKSKEGQTIRVGREFQASVPEWETPTPDNTVSEEEFDDFQFIDTHGTVCFWYPPTARQWQTDGSKDMACDDRIEKYISESVDKFGLQPEQALGILLFHDYNVSRARGELQQYKPAETGIDAWDADDRTMFQTAYRLHAKSFPKIKETLPNKSIAELVHYYYRWKKTQHCPKAKKSKSEKTGETGNPNRPNRRTIPDGYGRSYPVSELNMFDEEKKVPSLEDVTKDLDRLKNNPQLSLKGFREHEKVTEREIKNGYTCIQRSKQNASGAREKFPIEMDELNQLIEEGELDKDISTPEWDAKEIYKFSLGIKDKGKNFDLLAKIIRTKTADQLRAFFDDPKNSKYGLNNWVQKHEDAKK